MSPDLPRIIDPGKLADSGACLTGQLPLREMDRIGELILEREGGVDYSLQFSRDDKGQLIITGSLSARLSVRCQRCLNPMSLQVQSRIQVGVTEDRTRMADLPDEVEPVIAEDHKLSLTGLIEEELLLAMPYSPVHELSVCPGTGLVSEHTPKRESPFAVLKGLKTGK